MRIKDPGFHLQDHALGQVKPIESNILIPPYALKNRRQCSCQIGSLSELARMASCGMASSTISLM